ncbi:MAG: sulfatase [Actinomycetota bacterium]
MDPLTPPNVLILAIDSLRADAVSSDRVATPTLEAFAARGAAFTQCICTATTTTPSFSSMLTGCYPPKHGVRGLQGYRLSSRVTTLAEAFGRAGYHTFAEVTGPLLPETGVLRGFEGAHHRQGYRVPFFGWRDEVVAKMRAYPEPWLLLLHVWEVHRPFRSPPDFRKQFDRAGYHASVTATDAALAEVFDAAGDDALVVITGDHGEDYPDTRWDQQVNRAARIARKKLKVGKVWPWLEKKLAAHAVGHGFALHEHLVRVPLIVAGPQVEARTIPDQVRHVDLLPTLAELCGIEVPEGIDGRSLRPVMDGGTLPEEPAYMEAVGVKLEGKRIQGARTPDWKLLLPGGGKPALYKLDGGQPPDEKHNLYSRYPEVAHHLEGFIATIAESTVVAESGMTDEQEAVVEQHLRVLGYL